MKNTMYKLGTAYTTCGTARSIEEIEAMYNRLAKTGYIAEVEEDDEEKVKVTEMLVEESEELDRWYGIGSYKIIEIKKIFEI